MVTPVLGGHMKSVRHVIHGTTLVTNAGIERKGVHLVYPVFSAKSTPCECNAWGPVTEVVYDPPEPLYVRRVDQLHARSALATASLCCMSLLLSWYFLAPRRPNDCGPWAPRLGRAFSVLGAFSGIVALVTHLLVTGDISDLLTGPGRELRWLAVPNVAWVVWKMGGSDKPVSGVVFTSVSSVMIAMAIVFWDLWPQWIQWVVVE